MVLYAGQVKEKETFTYMVKVMLRHGDTLQFGFSDKGNMNEIEREDIVAKVPRPLSSGGTTGTKTLKYCSFNFLRKELYRQKSSVPL
jgi:hypothetical protein